MIYTCNTCHYTFKCEQEPDRCPDCGKFAVRSATEDEQTEYFQNLQENGEHMVSIRWNEQLKKGSDSI